MIAIYYPEFLIDKNKSLPIYCNLSTNQNKINRDCNNLTIYELIINHIDLAKKHGIFGFGINYYWFSGDSYYDEVINIFLESKEINFPYFIIWKNDYLNITDVNYKNVLINQTYDIKNALYFIQNIKKYFISDNYLKINQKPVLAIYESKVIPSEYLFHLRISAYECGTGPIIIFGVLKDIGNANYSKLFDFLYEFPPKNLNSKELIRNDYFYYSDLIYKGNFKYENNLQNITIYKGIMLEPYNISNSNKKEIIYFKGYSPEKFFLLNKLIINWTKQYHDKKDYYIFINAWNNMKEGFYLEPDEQYGYASINALSKAIFNLPFEKKTFNISNLEKICKVAVQAHIFYEDLIKEMINKTNNIPIPFDLFLSTTSFEMKNLIAEFVNNNSKANKFEITVLYNKGRDVLPLLTQLKDRIKKYKYICHIHSKKSKTSPEIGISWRNYLYNNLLGNNKIVSEILSDFESLDNLGFIFPETFYEIINLSLILTKKNKMYMNYILKIIFQNYKIGTQLYFPAGNMFWARVKAVHQIFEYNFDKMFSRENNQVNDTIMHAIERIWLYLVKLNGFFYKTIFKSIY